MQNNRIFFTPGGSPPVYILILYYLAAQVAAFAVQCYGI